MWNIESGDCLNTFVGHKSPVLSVQVSFKYLFGGCPNAGGCDSTTDESLTRCLTVH